MISWIDSHNHLHDACLGDTAAIIREMKAAGITRCVVNATSEMDWPAVEALAISQPDFISPAFGIHPWQAHTASEGWQTRLLKLLEKHPHASIGECGVVGWVSAPSLEIQMPVFIDQLRLAEQLNRPITVHCLKAWQPLFDAFSQAPPPEKFLMHSFGGSLEIAERLIPLGAYFSFSGYFLHPKKSKVLEVFQQLPRDRILLETDAPDMLPPREQITHPLADSLNHPANLPAIGSALAAALGMTSAALSGLTCENARRLFSEDLS